MLIFVIVAIVLVIVFVLLFKSSRGNYGSSTDSTFSSDPNFNSSDSTTDSFVGGGGLEFGGAGAGGSWGDDTGGGDSSDSGGGDSGD